MKPKIFFILILSQLWLFVLAEEVDGKEPVAELTTGGLNSTREGRGLLETIGGFIKTAQTVNQIFGSSSGQQASPSNGGPSHSVQGWPSSNAGGLGSVEKYEHNNIPASNQPGSTSFYNQYYQNQNAQGGGYDKTPADIPGPPYPENSVYRPVGSASSTVNKQGQLAGSGGDGGSGGLSQLLNGGTLSALGQLLGGGNLNNFAQILGAGGNQQGGSLGQLSGLLSQLGGSSGQFGGASGPFGGSGGQFGGSAAQLGGNQHGANFGQFGGLANQLGATSGQFGGLASQLGANSGQFGGLASQLGGSSGQFGGSPGSQFGGPSNQLGATSGQLGGLGQGQLGQLLGSSGLLPASLNELGIFDDLTDLFSIQNMEKLLKNVNQFDSLKCIPRMVCQTVARRQEEAEKLEREREESKRTSTTTTTTKRPKTKYNKRKDKVETSEREGRFLPGWKVQGVETALEQAVKFLDILQLKDWSLYPYLQGAHEGHQVRSWNECAQKFNTCPFSEEQLLYYFNNYKGGLFQSFRTDKD